MQLSGEPTLVKRRLHPGQRRGSILLYVLLLLTMFAAICSLAVDYGHVQFVKSEMQRCADATARGYMEYYNLKGQSYANSQIAQLYAEAQNPVDVNSGVTPTVTVTVGSWNASTSSFSTSTGTPVAVRVSVTRTAANGNAVPLMWGGVLGIGSIDVHASAVAALMGGQHTSVTLSALSNPYFAGMPNTTTNSWGDNFAMDAPYQVPSIPVVPGTYITFTNLAGTTSVVPGSVPYSGPGGDTSIAVNHGENWDLSFNNPGPENGIGDAIMYEDATMGVFLTNNAPNLSTAPSGQPNWTTGTLANKTVYSKIVVQQPFMIGNGQTTSGVVKQFLVPPGATRLYMAIWDGVEYNNNGGSLTGTVTVAPYVELMQ